VLLPWYIEYWHVILAIAGMAGTIILVSSYVRWIGKAKVAAPEKLMKRLATFYKLLALVSFAPVVSPSYLVAFSLLHMIGPFLPPMYGGAGVAADLMFSLFLSLVLGLLCVLAATRLLQSGERTLGLITSTLFAIGGVFVLKNLYDDLIWALNDPKYYWVPILLYVLASSSLTMMNLVSIYHLTRTTPPNRRMDFLLGMGKMSDSNTERHRASCKVDQAK